VEARRLDGYHLPFMATAEEFFGIELRVGVLGAMPSSHEVVLLEVERPVENGTRIG
jgi:hypothetical protein